MLGRSEVFKVGAPSEGAGEDIPNAETALGGGKYSTLRLSVYGIIVFASSLTVCFYR